MCWRYSREVQGLSTENTIHICGDTSEHNTQTHTLVMGVCMLFRYRQTRFLSTKMFAHVFLKGPAGSEVQLVAYLAHDRPADVMHRAHVEDVILLRLVQLAAELAEKLSKRKGTKQLH